jgi:hypothetical protein
LRGGGLSSNSNIDLSESRTMMGWLGGNVVEGTSRLRGSEVEVEMGGDVDVSVRASARPDGWGDSSGSGGNK